MTHQTTENRSKRNLLLMGAAVLFVAIAVVFCLLMRKPQGSASAFRVRFGNGTVMEFDAQKAQTIIIRNGTLVEEMTGEGEENVIRIENGSAWMEHATCPHHECMEQGVLRFDTVKSRPLGPWIICAPHSVSIEYIGDGE